MRLALFIIVVFAGMIGVIFAYQWLMDKLGLDIKPPQKQQQLHIVPRNLYEFYRLDYENVAEGVYNCLATICTHCQLAQVCSPSNVHAARVSDRVRVLEDGTLVFIYELRRELDYSSPLSKNIKSNKKDVEFIASVFQVDLPVYLRNGYFFTGPVVGFDVDDRIVRIEVYGINRCTPNGGDGFFEYY